MNSITNYIDCLVQDCSISSALAMEILQSCTKHRYYLWKFKGTVGKFQVADGHSD